MRRITLLSSIATVVALAGCSSQSDPATSSAAP